MVTALAPSFTANLHAGQSASRSLRFDAVSNHLALP